MNIDVIIFKELDNYFSASINILQHDSAKT